MGDKTNQTYQKLSSVLHPEYPVYSRHHQHIKDKKFRNVPERRKWRQVIHDSLHIISLDATLAGREGPDGGAGDGGVCYNLEQSIGTSGKLDCKTVRIFA